VAKPPKKERNILEVDSSFLPTFGYISRYILDIYRRGSPVAKHSKKGEKSPRSWQLFPPHIWIYI